MPHKFILDPSGTLYALRSLKPEELASYVGAIETGFFIDKSGAIYKKEKLAAIGEEEGKRTLLDVLVEYKNREGIDAEKDGFEILDYAGNPHIDAHLRGLFETLGIALRTLAAVYLKEAFESLKAGGKGETPAMRANRIRKLASDN